MRGSSNGRRGHGGRSQLIVNADDFGGSSAINEAVVRAHRSGILTSASLMVTAEKADEAVALAREHPTLAVGLHVVLADGRPALPASQIPGLLDAAGQFPRSPIRAGLRYMCRRGVRAEIEREVRAQFERFAATGLPLSHVDGHMHMHLHPAVLPAVMRLAVEFGAHGVRLPRDRIGPALGWDRRRTLTKATWALVFGLLSRSAARRLRREGIAFAERAYGLMQSGSMRERYVVDLLGRIRDASAELYFHPTTGTRTDRFGPNPGDLQSLLSPEVRQIIEDRHLELTTYPMLSRP